MSSLPTQSRQWTLTTQPTGKPTYKGSNPSFTLETKDLPPLKDNQVLVQTLYLSNDPAQRGWISARIEPERLYVPPVQVGSPMRARAVARILESSSSSPEFQKGKLVLGSTNWSQFAVLPIKECQPAPELPGGLSPTHYLGALGLTGLTAYYGFVDVAQATKEDVVVVSGAAGATGCMVVQIAKKMLGCKRVVGIAGGAEKCRWVQELGADACVDYKAHKKPEELRNAIKDALEGGYADVFFDNVGGEVLDQMLTRMATHGRIAQCGAIANYNAEDQPHHMKNYFQVISQRLQIRGFIVLDGMQKPGYAQEVVGKFVGAMKEGKIKLSDDMETVVESKFDEIPQTWMRLFDGKNQGKLVTKLTDA